MKFLPIIEFESRQKSIDPNSKLALMSSMIKTKNEVIEKKKRAKAGFLKCFWSLKLTDPNL